LIGLSFSSVPMGRGLRLREPCPSNELEGYFRFVPTGRITESSPKLSFRASQPRPQLVEKETPTQARAPVPHTLFFSWNFLDFMSVNFVHSKATAKRKLCSTGALACVSFLKNSSTLWNWMLCIQICPVGTFENSPSFQRRELDGQHEFSSHRDD
jgi:hypothetical protein